MTALDWLCHGISDHLFCRAPFVNQLLHIHLMSDEEILNVDTPRMFPTGGFSAPLKQDQTLIVLQQKVLNDSISLW
jgi:hypothetical protein